jgi:hypothetical protein
MDYGGYFNMVLYIHQCFAHYLGVWVVFLEDVKSNGVCNHVIFISFKKILPNIFKGFYKCVLRKERLGGKIWFDNCHLFLQWLAT